MEDQGSSPPHKTQHTENTTTTTTTATVTDHTPRSTPSPRKHPEKQKTKVTGDVVENGRKRTQDGTVVGGIPRAPRAVDGGSGPRRKLVLHVDLRNTILVADSVTNVAVEQALNAFLTGATWGEEKEGRWEWVSDQPSIKPPAQGKVTYYKFLERQLVRTPSERTVLRLATGDFTSTPIGTMFRTDFLRHLASLKWNYGEEKGEHRLLTMAGTDGQRYHYILEGLYRLIQHLHEAGRDFALVIRTYGLDAPNALASLAHGVKGHHPGFPRPMPVPVNRATGNIRRPERDVIVLEAFRSQGRRELLAKLTHERDIYRFLSRSLGISGYKDDFQFWQSNGYNHHAGKPLWIDPQDVHHHHLIFDDNFRALDEDSIVDVRVFSKEDNTRAYSLSKTQLSRLEDVCLVQADLLESIDDRDYFLRKVDLCEANYSRMLKMNAFPC
ncbi:uncharacterized protein LOC143299671 [Babylonia areolata]|uniref:uncharacterized protein LOC143299671 n=1 Tax=Babylonia areolata TaxID=304850 RepID=UPI003FD47164